MPDLGWVGFDAANGICTTDAHARVAIGLDYLGAAPVRGTRYGGGTETLTVAVKVEQAGAAGAVAEPVVDVIQSAVIRGMGSVKQCPRISRMDPSVHAMRGHRRFALCRTRNDDFGCSLIQPHILEARDCCTGCCRAA